MISLFQQILIRLWVSKTRKQKFWMIEIGSHLSGYRHELPATILNAYLVWIVWVVLLSGEISMVFYWNYGLLWTSTFYTFYISITEGASGVYAQMTIRTDTSMTEVFVGSLGIIGNPWEELTQLNLEADRNKTERKIKSSLPSNPSLQRMLTRATLTHP